MAEDTHAPTPLAAGAPAPPFTLPGRSGSVVSLADFAGKGHVLVYFYPKDDTPGCTKEACSLRDGFSDLRAAGVTVLGISPDGAASHAAFAEKYSLPFELLTDADHSVHEAYGVWGKTPWGLGTIRRSFLVGPDGAIVRVFDDVDVERHAGQVLAALKPTPVAEAFAAVEAAVEAAGAAVSTAVSESRKAVKGAMKSPEVKDAVAAAKKAVADVKDAVSAARKRPAVKKAVAGAKKAVAGAKKAVADVKKKPAVKRAVAKAKKAVADAKKRPVVKKAVASAKKAVTRAKTAAAKEPKGALARLLSLVTPAKAAPKSKAAARKKAAKKAAPRKPAARKPAPRKAAPVRKAARMPAPKKAVSARKPARKPVVKKAPRRKASRR
ncbi:MAG: peroxiredoxin [Thermoanaerobaculia bacterium]